MNNRDVKRFMSIWELIGEANSAGYKFKKNTDTPDVEVMVSVSEEPERPSKASFDKCVDNNLKGIELEKAGEIDKAIKLYEANVAAHFVGPHPYKRLAIIYRKRKDYENEIRVLNAAIKQFGQESNGTDGQLEPSDFYKRLIKAKELQEKENKK